MPTSVGARGSYLLEDVTVISTELVRLYRLYRLYRLVGLCRLLSSLTGLNRLSGLLSRRDIRGHCLGRFVLAVVQAVLRGEHLSRRIITRSVGGVLRRVAPLCLVTGLSGIAILSSVAALALCLVAVLCVSLGCAVTAPNTRRRPQSRSLSATTLTTLRASRRDLLAEQEEQNQDEQ